MGVEKKWTDSSGTTFGPILGYIYEKYQDGDGVDDFMYECEDCYNDAYALVDGREIRFVWDNSPKKDDSDIVCECIINPAEKKLTLRQKDEDYKDIIFDIDDKFIDFLEAESSEWYGLDDATFEVNEKMLIHPVFPKR